MPETVSPTLAAQYLRMSTEHQQYSLENQSEAIAEYAARHGFQVVATYKDAAKSGLTLRHRQGLSKLLQDVISNPPFKAVLVYDVSRWGRFQDVDESAHYEFLCRSAGVPICYCAEMFANDGSLTSHVLKGLKRAMAAEYSRELGEKVFRGSVRLVEMGYKMGGSAPFGLRRMLVSPDGHPKQILERGVRKSFDRDRVVYAPGPENEVSTVKLIFHLVLERHMRPKAIARHLNEAEIPFFDGKRWQASSVSNLLKNPRYAGANIWGQSTSRLHTRVQRLPKDRWIVKDGVFSPVIESKLFEEAQRVLQPFRPTGGELLQALSRVWREKGSVTQEILCSVPEGPRYATVLHHFGTLRHALDLIGYTHCRNEQLAKRRSRATQSLQHVLAKRLARMFPARLQLTWRRRGRHLDLILDRKAKISILIAPRRVTSVGKHSWMITALPGEHGNIALCCMMDGKNRRISSMYFVRDLPVQTKMSVAAGSNWFSRAVPLENLRGFCRVATQVINKSATA